jgi:thioredoxin 1
MLMGATVELTDTNFKEKVSEASVPVLVDFWAPWCGPCRLIAPIVDELATKYEGKLQVGKVNTDDNQVIASEYNIRAIPTLMLFKDGEVVDQIVGQVSKDQLSARVDQVLGA